MEGPTVQLVVTCLVDALAPQVGRATVTVLTRAGCQVEFPEGQTCCGQPAFNVGMLTEARRMAGHTLDLLDVTQGTVVVPSGSCADMMTRHYAELFAGTDREQQAERVGSRVRELSQFLVDDLDTDLKGSCDGCTVAYHHSCHGLRGLGLGHQAEQLLSEVEMAELEGAKDCCGFGGVFAIEMPAVSAAIMNEKLDRIEASGADTLVGGDVSCLIHLEGGLRRRNSKISVKHLAEILAGDDS
ncbi:MAG: (Fe-S)-binding protein [Acidimicrobiia bacterium]